MYENLYENTILEDFLRKMKTETMAINPIMKRFHEFSFIIYVSRNTLRNFLIIV